MSEFSDLVPRPTDINDGLSPASAETMRAALGDPGQGLTADQCQNALASSTVTQLLETRNFGHFSATGIKPALDSLGRIFDAINRDNADLFAAIGSAGMLCVRLRRPTSGVPSTDPSNHSWGTAIDISIDGVADTNPDAMIQKGIAAIIKYFNDEGWFSGVGFSHGEDDTHFEVSNEFIQMWQAAGRFDSPDLPPAHTTVDDLARSAFDFFIGTNWSNAQAAGLIANIEAESSFQAHGAPGDGGLAKGLCQWHPDRQAKFSTLFPGRDFDSSTFDEQLQLVNFELSDGGGGENEAGTALKNSTSPNDCGAIVCRLYERPQDKDGSVAASRGTRAAFWFNKFG